MHRPPRNKRAFVTTPLVSTHQLRFERVPSFDSQPIPVSLPKNMSPLVKPAELARTTARYTSSANPLIPDHGARVRLVVEFVPAWVMLVPSRMKSEP